MRKNVPHPPTPDSEQATCVPFALLAFGVLFMCTLSFGFARVFRDGNLAQILMPHHGLKPHSVHFCVA